MIITTSQKPQDAKVKGVRGIVDKKVDNVEGNKVDPKVVPDANKIETKNEADVIAGDVEKELKEAREKLAVLELRIKELEAATPKKFKPVKFQNYGNRKRILVDFFRKSQKSS
jgi:hypothetical protein